MERQQPSGLTMQDRELYKQREPKHRPFVMLHCWALLQQNEKWVNRNNDPHPLKKRASSDMDSEGCGDDDRSGRSTTPSLERPPGRKQEKKRLKRRGGDALVIHSAVHDMITYKKEMEASRKVDNSALLPPPPSLPLVPQSSSVAAPADSSSSGGLSFSAMAGVTVLVVLVFLGALVESRTSGTFYRSCQLFVFGDSFADTGNIPKSHLSQVTRQWYRPYGSRRILQEGRFSDGSVQTDFMAKIVLGRYRMPPMTYRIAKGFGDPKGMNFAHGGAGVFEVPQKRPSLSKQIHYLKQLIQDGIIHKWQLKESVALVAISGNDYERAANMSSENEILAFVGNVTAEIAKGVERLRKIGVTKVLVNNLHPMGCMPWQTRPVNYTKCTGKGNMAADLHNENLKNKLNAAKSDSVYVVDLNKAFSSIVNPSDPKKSPKVAKEFTHKLMPCCRSYDPNGYCGQVDEHGKPQYSLCDNPENHFYWDDAHPSEAGWEAIMEQLEEDMTDFLDSSD
ncbi:hypothetical protein QOZ80_2BG0180200 [Eleusine coracana subsp. coracana]|nr:hypothetical protein QOZ80_2BG0180200 [Eleusine coracana subsp. coracana]